MDQEILNFINRLEGYRSIMKFLHWAAPRRSRHEVLDDAFSDLGDFEDEFAEDAQAIYGQVSPDDCNPIPAKSKDDIGLMKEIRADLANMKLYLDKPMYTGLVNEVEDYFHKVNKTIYLLNLSN